MSRFWSLWRLTWRTMLFVSSGCNLVAEPIFAGDAGVDVGIDGEVVNPDAGPDAAPNPVLTSRLLIADGAGVIAFDRLDQRAPFADAVRWDDVTAAVVGSGVLFLGRPGTAPIAMFDDAGRLEPIRTPTRELNETEAGGAIDSIEEMRVDENGTLWVLLGSGDVRAYFQAAFRLPDESISAAPFRDGHLDGFAYDAATDRLYAGPGDAGQVLVWVNALTRESLGPSTFAFGGDCRVTAMTIGADLYAACNDGRIAVWEAPQLQRAGAEPARTLQPRGRVQDLQLQNGTLMATGPTGVDLWRVAGSAEGEPDVHVEVGGERALRDSSDTLFVLTADDVHVVQNATSDPTVAGQLRTERLPLDIAQ
ncbi:MAG: hypothetical protein AAGE52_34675 [Myxococcota bacterium]